VVAPLVPDDVPRCPVPGHENSKVVLGGRYGKPGRQRQLYVCDRPKPGSTARTHRFAAPLPRSQPGGTEAEPPEELRSARHYQFTAQDIAAGLVAVSRGRSYADAGQEARARAARRWGGAEPARRHGSLVSDWVEVYAEALWRAQAPAGPGWPDTVLVGMLPLTVAAPRGARPGLAFSVFAAVCHTPGEGLRFLGIRTAAGTSTAHWTEFLAELAAQRPGRPAVLVGDGSVRLARAVTAVWPDPPLLWTDEHELRGQAQRLLRARGLADRNRPLWTLLLRAWRAPEDWAAFLAEAARYRLPELDRWIARAAPVMDRQFALRRPGVRRSRQSLRSVLRGLDERLAGRRAAFGNRARTDRLLLLMALDLSGQGRVNTWAQLICAWLERSGGRPTTPQRRIADPSGRPSLRPS
jgi:hypothetical protein